MQTTAQPQTMQKPFVDRWNFQADAVYAHNVSSYQFLLEGDLDALQNYAQRYFNTPSGGEIDIHPLSAHVLLQISTAERLDGGDGAYPNNYPNLGVERSAALLFFAVDRQNDDAVVLACPYLIVDNPTSMMLAREAFGMPKEMGEVNIPPGQQDPDVISVNVLGAKDVRVPGASYQMQPLLQVSNREGTHEHHILDLVDGLKNAFMQPANGLAKLEAGLSDLVDLGGLAAHSIGLLVAGEFRLVCLKQFRTETNNALAAYQKVVALRSKIQHRDGFRPMFGRYHVEFADVSSHPIAADLGLKGVVDSHMSFWMGYDFSITGEAYP